MKASFSPSINIVRDSGRHLNYIPTANSHRIFDQITSEFRTGVRSFSIIGSYGTGKSAFLWALEKQLIGGQPYFGHLNGSFSGYKNFEFISIVGEYRSIIGAFARRLGIKSQFNAEKATLDKLSRHCAAQAKQGTCVVIIVDELGKFLEFAAKNVPEKELYFVQQLAEFCNDPSKNVLLITCLHQSFESYSNELNLTNRNEWEKVKGRLKELTFNEPIEQLLNLASEHLQKGERRSQLGAHLKDLTAAIKFSQCFALESSSFNLAHGLLPLDLLAAAVLALALQKYGQNERSLFSFLESNDYLGLRGFDSDVIPYYDLSCVYDYLIGNHYSFISTKENQHYVQWAAIRSSIERIEGTVENEPAAASRLVKAIGLLNIFARETARIDARFLSTYGKLAMGIDDTDSIINELERKKIIRFVRFKSRYILFEGTDFDIELALNVASGKVDQVNDITTSLNQYFVFPFVQAKGAHYKYGTPRLFEYRLTDRPYLEPLGAEVDGIVNLVFSDSADIEQIKTLSRSSKEAILYAIYRETKRIRELLWEIDKVKYTLSTVVDDRVARRELSNLLEDLIRQLNRTVLNDLYEEGKGTIWISGGRVLRIRNRTEFNRALSRICERVYTETPRYHNELINRNKLPGALVTARKKLMEAIILAWGQTRPRFRKWEIPTREDHLSLVIE